MSEQITVGLALSSRPWRGALQRHCRDHVADISVTLVRDARDALDSSLDLVIVDDDTSWLSSPFVSMAREAGMGIIGFYDPLEADGHGQRHLQTVGVDSTVPASLSTEDLIDLVRQLRPDVAMLEAFDAIAAQDSDRVTPEQRRIIAIGGPAGAGATEVSVGFAQRWSKKRNERVILIDVDETHPTIARRLGLGIHPHVITAVEALRGERLRLDNGEGQTVEGCLAQPAVAGSAIPFDVIAGLASRDDWTLLRSDDLDLLVSELSARWPAVVARIGPQLEDLSRSVDRFGSSRAIAASASHIIGVCDGSSTGILRFVDWLVDLVPLVGDSPIDVVINRPPRSAAAQSQLIHQLREIAGDRVNQIEIAPRDRNIERAAWDATLASKGRFLKAMDRLVAGVANPTQIEPDQPLAKNDEEKQEVAA